MVSAGGGGRECCGWHARRQIGAEGVCDVEVVQKSSTGCIVGQCNQPYIGTFVHGRAPTFCAAAAAHTEMARRRLLEESPIPSTNEEPVLFDTSEIPWWAWVRRFHLPEVRGGDRGVTGGGDRIMLRSVGDSVVFGRLWKRADTGQGAIGVWDGGPGCAASTCQR
jgi:hypothetical protein